MSSPSIEHPGSRRGIVWTILNRLWQRALGGVVHLRTLEPEFSTDGTLLAKGSGMMRYASS